MKDFPYLCNMQTRCITGIEFENEVSDKTWVRNEIRPKLIWDVEGRDNISKIKKINYDVTKFNLSPKSVLVKSDLVNINNPELTCEVKKYYIRQFNNWTMYSEPFFKIARRKQIEEISTYDYNRCVEDFYNMGQDIINKVLNSIVKSNIGIRCIDGFVPQENLEFKTDIVHSAWAGYKRITIFCRLK